jgi:histidinol-phosphate aminotransferase
MGFDAVAAQLYASRTAPALASLTPYVPGPTLEQLAQRTGRAVGEIVKLSSAESPLPPSAALRRTLSAFADSDDAKRYPDSSMLSVRAAIAHVNGVDVAHVLVGAGSEETWRIAVNALTRPGDEVAAIVPSSAAYHEIALLADRTPRHIRGSDVQPTPDEVIEGAQGASLLFISSPNNTTGLMYSTSDIEAIAEGCPSVIVIVDEDYMEAATEFPQSSAMPLTKIYPNLLVGRTLAKLYGIAGLDVGYLVGPQPAIELLERYRPLWNLNRAAQLAAIAVLGDQGRLAEVRTMTLEGRDKMCAALTRLGYHVCSPSQAPFVTFELPQHSAEELSSAFLSHAVALRVGGFERYVRAGVGLPGEVDSFVRAAAAVRAELTEQ